MSPCCLEYVWIDNDYNLRSKIRIMHDAPIDEPITIRVIPEWNYDGSSTNQASGDNSEIILKPQRMFQPNVTLNEIPHILVLCDTYTHDGIPLKTNNRVNADEIFNNDLDASPWYGIEQEYFLIDPKTNKPLGYDETKSQGQYYCSVGTANAFGRSFAEEHMLECIKYGITISGINAEVAPGQWEYQVGPCTGIDAGDHLWMSRYLLHKLGEKHNVIVTMDPKPLDGNWNGSGCHVNYSTKHMREGSENKCGLDYINIAIDKLSKKHKEHMKVYGDGNEKRMTGNHETASYDIFTSGTANRGASIRIGNMNVKNKKGYFEDRRPSSNCDPYLVTSMLFKTTIVDA